MKVDVEIATTGNVPSRENFHWFGNLQPCCRALSVKGDTCPKTVNTPLEWAKQPHKSWTHNSKHRAMQGTAQAQEKTELNKHDTIDREAHPRQTRGEHGDRGEWERESPTRNVDFVTDPAGRTVHGHRGPPKNCKRVSDSLCSLKGGILGHVPKHTTKSTKFSGDPGDPGRLETTIPRTPPKRAG